MPTTSISFNLSILIGIIFKPQHIRNSKWHFLSTKYKTSPTFLEKKEKAFYSVNDRRKIGSTGSYSLNQLIPKNTWHLFIPAGKLDWIRGPIWNATAVVAWWVMKSSIMRPKHFGVGDVLLWGIHWLGNLRELETSKTKWVKTQKQKGRTHL